MAEPVLVLDQVWKSYPRWTAGARTLRGVLQDRLPGGRRHGPPLWALQDVSMEVRPGEAVGVIGANGAGKSTLLRLAAGLGRPARGRLSGTDDRAAVLSLGAAADPALTGRENAVTTAVVLGLTPAQARAAAPSIIEFAELEGFAEAPVRTYSEGMKLRLAFGVVAQLAPRLLVVDEVLSVGDLRFQAKCLARVSELRESGTALVFASHDLEQVAEHCDRVIWLHGGAVRGTGSTEEVLAAYRGAMHSATVARTPAGPPEGELELRRNRFGSQEMRITAVRVLDAAGGPAQEVASGTSLTVLLDVDQGELTQEPLVGVSIARASDRLVCVDVTSEGAALQVPPGGRATIAAAFPPLALAPGEYVVSVGAYAPGWDYAYDYHWDAYPLRITGAAGDGVLRVTPRWSVGGGGAG